MSVCLKSHGPSPVRLLCPWNSPRRNTGMGSHSLSRGSFPPRDWTWVSCIAGRLFTVWATREALIVNTSWNRPEGLTIRLWLGCCLQCAPQRLSDGEKASGGITPCLLQHERHRGAWRAEGCGGAEQPGGQAGRKEQHRPWLPHSMFLHPPVPTGSPAPLHASQEVHRGTAPEPGNALL